MGQDELFNISNTKDMVLIRLKPKDLPLQPPRESCTHPRGRGKGKRHGLAEMLELGASHHGPVAKVIANQLLRKVTFGARS